MLLKSYDRLYIFLGCIGDKMLKYLVTTDFTDPPVREQVYLFLRLQ